jgi:hypothetical protein
MREPFDVSGLRSGLDPPSSSGGARVRRLLVFVAVSVIAFAVLLALVLAVTGLPDRVSGR